ncbi:MAG: hypothetical protein JSS79_08575 [Bacteroidetes bacterium]|nr:hypothetical protein [Bacteroidota bacterium]
MKIQRDVLCGTQSKLSTSFHHDLRQTYLKLFFGLLFLLLVNPEVWAAPPVGCALQGTNPVSTYTSFTYSLNGTACAAAASWTTTCGSVVVGSDTPTSVTIYFNAPGCSSTVIKAWDSSNNLIASLTVTINSAPALWGGSISNTSQTINYSTTPALLNASSATNGSCGSYSYLWYSSSDNVTFTAISGATGQNYQPGVLTSTTYFKRGVTCGYQSAYSNVATVSVYPQLVSGTAGPSNLSINYGSAPGVLTVSAASGGNGTYTYQWQSSSAINGTYNAIAGATGTNYSPGSLLSTTYYTVATTSNGVSVNSSPITITVYPQLVGGSVSMVGSSPINYGDNPGQLSSSGVSGGTGTYSYQWQNSTDGATFSNVSGATTSTYTAPAITSTTYYRVVVSSNGVSANSSSLQVSVYPTLQAGSISPATQIATTSSTPTILLNDQASGGSNSFNFQWNQSSNGTTWAAIPGANKSSYQPPVLSSTQYYSVTVNSGGYTATTSSAVVNVYPSMVPGTVSPTAFMIDAGTSAGVLTSTAATLGACSGAYSYEWQSSTDGTNFTGTGVTTLSYLTPAVNTKTWFRVKITCGPEVQYTNSAIVNVSILTTATGLNYLRTREIQIAGIPDASGASQLTDPNTVKTTTQYVDGLGRPVQSVVTQGSPTQKDLVSLQTYDDYGREVFHYMPYAASTADGNFKTQPITGTNTFNKNLYPSENFFQGKTDYEASPLSRPLKSYSPGNAWVGNQRGVGAQDLTNQANEVLLFNYDSNSGLVSLASGTAGYYGGGQLSVKKTTNEHGNEVIEYVDKESHTVCKKVQSGGTDAQGNKLYASTYYIYDDLGNLVVVLPPEAIHSALGYLSPQN